MTIFLVIKASRFFPNSAKQVSYCIVGQGFVIIKTSDEEILST